ncbi:hypothetical protein BKA59DRAFT_544702 [Fusarium tricinctum]|uniref:2EXR domain-containing protein n=1 Tax=Fusarium tricinctum TaxID=61284 RepID=A0A8K0RTG0_9HYPO|nr:hypothetical protein BKA59DRAFT_544702 [Fusarium tricinctum]
MASSTFHPFSRLPTELRLKIWEAACFPFQQHHKGLHYVELLTVGDYSTRMRQMKRKNQHLDSDHSSNSANPSAYIWDVGLWKACKESREVILRHLNIDNPIKVRTDIQEDSSRPVSRENDGNDVQLGYLYNRDNSQQHKLAVRPSQDIFCIRGGNWRPPEYSFEFTDIWIPLVNQAWYALKICNLAFEFDPSWNNNLSKSGFRLSEMIKENSPRGMFAKALYHTADGNTSPQLWIIDKSTPWLRSTDQDIHTVYYDCKHAYVEIAWEDTRSDTTKQARYGLASEFIEDLSFLGQDDYNSYRFRAEMSRLSNSYLNTAEFDVKDAVKLLVRRDNEVKQFTDEDHYDVQNDSDYGTGE